MSRATAVRALAAFMVLATWAAGAAAETNFAGAPPAGPHVITIKGVYLKDDRGDWVKIVEPDRLVDLEREEPVISFFNNRGRVPAGAYKNFRIDFTGDGPALRRFYSKNDFEQSVAVKKGSFIRVSFGISLKEGIEVERADVTVDSESRRLPSEALTLEE